MYEWLFESSCHTIVRFGHFFKIKMVSKAKKKQVKKVSKERTTDFAIITLNQNKLCSVGERFNRISFRKLHTSKEKKTRERRKVTHQLHNLESKSRAINFRGCWKLWKQRCRNAFKVNTNIVLSTPLAVCVSVLWVCVRARPLLRNTVPNDLSLTKRFLMHIFYFASCNYDKLLNSQWHRKLVNGIFASVNH